MEGARAAHINIQESASVYRLMKRGALVHPSSRFSIVMDSNVGLSAFVKGRSPSHGLRKVLRRTGAVAVAGCLYPAYHFGPTRLNIADCPTRDSELPSPCKSFSELLPAVRDLYAISNVGPLRRFASNWVRLFLLVYGGSLPWKEDQECWKFSHLSYSAMPFSSKPFLQRVSHSVDFDSSCGFPGEGPGFWTYALLLSHTFCLSPTSLSSSLISGIWISVSCAVGFGFNGARYPHKPQISFYWVVGRPVLGQTQHYRDKLLDHFTGWLRLQGVSFEELVMTPVPDVEGINLLLEKYGRALFDAGRPYNHYAELINSVAAKKPALRRNLQAAWDLAYTWLRLEPPIHHIALPWQALLSILTISVSWGWLRVAGVIALSWGGITRIGEVLGALRKNLILPADVGGSTTFALLEISEPKTRFSGAHHQSARLDQPQLLRLVDLAFRALRPEQKLWPANVRSNNAYQISETVGCNWARLLAVFHLSPTLVSHSGLLGCMYNIIENFYICLGSTLV